MTPSQILKVVGTYAVVALAYIYLSDSLVQVLWPGQAYRISLYKGFGFVVLTAAGLTLALHHYAKERTRTLRSLESLTRLYAMLSATNGLIVRARSEDELFQGICRIAVEQGGFAFAWVGRADGTGGVLPVARAGEDRGYLDKVRGMLPLEERAGGAAGRALRSGEPAVRNDFEDGLSARWREAARNASFSATAALPIRRDGTLFGALTLYAKRRGFFTEERLRTLEEMASDVSFGLGNLAHERERRRTEHALKRSEALYREMFESNPRAMFVFDQDTLEILAANRAALHQYGYPEEEFLSLSFADLRPPSEREGLAERLRHVRQQRFVAAGVWRHLRRDGTVLDVDVTAHAIRHAERPAWLVLALDVTERERLERERHAAEEKFRAISEQSLTGIHLIEEERLAYVNPRGAEIFGYAPGEMHGRPLAAFVHPEDRALVAERLRVRLQGTGTGEPFEFRGLRKEGTEVVVGSAAVPAAVGGRKVLLGVMQDITDKRHAEATIRGYIERLEAAVLGTASAVSQMVELRDPYTAGHERRVGELSAALAAELGLEDHVQQGLRVAGAVHDVGKIVVPAEILSKPGRLNHVERELVKGHAEHGYQVLKDVPFPWPVAEVARQHHERLDGSGYPRGLKGGEILLEARILAVADVVESMASHRPYRPGLGMDRALQEIESGAGTLYDPDVSAACRRLFLERGYQLPQ